MNLVGHLDAFFNSLIDTIFIPIKWTIDSIQVTNFKNQHNLKQVQPILLQKGNMNIRQQY